MLYIIIISIGFIVSMIMHQMTKVGDKRHNTKPTGTPNIWPYVEGLLVLVIIGLYMYNYILTKNPFDQTYKIVDVKYDPKDIYIRDTGGTPIVYLDSGNELIEIPYKHPQIVQTTITDNVIVTIESYQDIWKESIQFGFKQNMWTGISTTTAKSEIKQRVIKISMPYTMSQSDTPADKIQLYQPDIVNE